MMGFILSKGNRMIKFRAIAATTAPCLNKYQKPLTTEDLNKFIGHTDVVTLDYTLDTVVGCVTKAWVENNQLHVEGGITQKQLIEYGKIYCAISYKCNVGEDQYVLKPMLYCFTTTPADTGTTPIEEIE